MSIFNRNPPKKEQILIFKKQKQQMFEIVAQKVTETIRWDQMTCTLTDPP